MGGMRGQLVGFREERSGEEDFLCSLAEACVKTCVCTQIGPGSAFIIYIFRTGITAWVNALHAHLFVQDKCLSCLVLHV